MPFSNHDVVPDSPINNFAVLNALNLKSNQVLLESNLRFQTVNTNNSDGATSTVAMPNSGKYYIEVVPHDTLDHGSRIIIGVTADPSKNTISQNYVGLGSDTYSWTSRTGVDHSFVSTGNWFLRNGDSPTYAANAIYQIFYDSDNLKIWMGKNNNWYSSSGLISGTPNFSTDETMQVSADLHQKGMFFLIQIASELGQVKKATINFGQDPTFAGSKSPTTTYPDANGIGQFHCQPPDGALALCTANLPEGYIKLSQDQTPSDNFRAVTYFGNSTTNIITGVGFQPDLVWCKGRDVGYSHGIYDAVRGASFKLSSNLTNAQVSEGMSSLDGDGFTLTGDNGLNQTAKKYVAWCWKAAGSPDQDYASANDGSAKIINENGSANTSIQDCAALATTATNAGASNLITPSKVSANRQNGFSIVKYNGTGTSDDVNYSIPHGLSYAPDVVIVKNLDLGSQSSGLSWPVLFTNIGGMPGLDGKLDKDNISGGADADRELISNWGGSYPNANTFFVRRPSISSSTNRYRTMGAYNYIAYCWHSVEGYSKCGSYVGNGSPDGPYVACGFRPAFVIRKIVNLTYGWYLDDNARNPKNMINDFMRADEAGTEVLNDPNYGIDLLSNGFKVRSSHITQNASGETYIFMAFAEQPFSGPSNAR